MSDIDAVRADLADLRATGDAGIRTAIDTIRSRARQEPTTSVWP